MNNNHPRRSFRRTITEQRRVAQAAVDMIRIVIAETDDHRDALPALARIEHTISLPDQDMLTAGDSFCGTDAPLKGPTDWTWRLLESGGRSAVNRRLPNIPSVLTLRMVTETLIRWSGVTPNILTRAADSAGFPIDDWQRNWLPLAWQRAEEYRAQSIFQPR